jgi:sulfur transfer protein SufE
MAVGEFEPILTQLVEAGRLRELFRGQRDKTEANSIRLCLTMFNGEFVITFKEATQVDYTIDTESRVIRGLYPMSVEELGRVHASCSYSDLFQAPTCFCAGVCARMVQAQPA